MGLSPWACELSGELVWTCQVVSDLKLKPFLVHLYLPHGNHKRLTEHLLQKGAATDWLVFTFQLQRNIMSPNRNFKVQEIIIKGFLVALSALFLL